MSKKRSTEQTPKEAKINITKANDFRDIYANWIQTSFTPFDITMLVGQVTPSTSVVPAETVNEFDVLQTARITISPPEAKLVAVMLYRALHDWERTFGKIVIPTQAIPTELAAAIQTLGGVPKADDGPEEPETGGI